MDPDAVAMVFVEHYYSTFDSNRAGLANLYQDTSILTFEGEKIQESQSIASKLAGLPFQQCKHNITTVDCQPSGPVGGMLVFVSGNLQLSGEQHALKFSQESFVSMKKAKGIKESSVTIRDWGQMDSNDLIIIFQRLRISDLLLGVAQVCSEWRKAASHTNFFIEEHKLDLQLVEIRKLNKRM